jgi:hypothetical protein
MSRVLSCVYGLILGLWVFPVWADTYNYSIAFGVPGGEVEGTVVTDCDNCAVYSGNLVSWTFSGTADGLHVQTVSSADANAYVTVSLPPGVVMPLTATSTGLYWNFNYHYADGTAYVPKWDGSDPSMCFCVWVNPYMPGNAESFRFLMFTHDDVDHLMVYYFLWSDYADLGNPLVAFAVPETGNLLLGTLSSVIANPPLVATPLPATLPLFGGGLGLLGLLAWRRKRKAIDA